jgi:hypothetical protein
MQSVLPGLMAMLLLVRLQQTEGSCKQQQQQQQQAPLWAQETAALQLL